MELRAHVATGIIDAGLDLATDMGKQMKVGKLLSLIVPARIVTRAQLISAVSSIMADYEILRVDFPKVSGLHGLWLLLSFASLVPPPSFAHPPSPTPPSLPPFPLPPPPPL